MTPFCSDPFDALQVASEVLGLPVRTLGEREPQAETSERPSLSVSEPVAVPEPSRSLSARPWLRAANKEQT